MDPTLSEIRQREEGDSSMLAKGLLRTTQLQPLCEDPVHVLGKAELAQLTQSLTVALIANKMVSKSEKHKYEQSCLLPPIARKDCGLVQVRETGCAIPGNC